ncbi:hypothetical protein BJ875DRAFT_455934 [Amylocarpus encephaloides]|uniref:Uncharacterized protein n=1 Tax=Amylocarpus encephaloides TaxID=45428 RepID=A0A9P8C7D5_9HELO|nr:hypothetical protein BJ875DRAFT_455934 [Amylocarpus encephaloides]
MFTSAFRWLQRKRYQYEVTFSLYMLTPTEKFIFNSFLFLFFSMIIIAMTLYLPQHITFLTSRAWFYYNGDEKLGAAMMGNESTRAMVQGVVKETIVAAVEGSGREL